MVARNDVIINTEKTVTMFFHSNQFSLPNKPQTVFSNTFITYKPAVMLLGIYITENLKWYVHIHSLCSSMIKVSYIIKSLKEVLSPYMLRSIYFAYFESCLGYGIIL